jgi:hypothetical protein
MNTSSAQHTEYSLMLWQDVAKSYLRLEREWSSPELVKVEWQEACGRHKADSQNVINIRYSYPLPYQRGVSEVAT